MVEARSDRDTKRGELYVGRDRLDDEEFVAEAAIETMKKIVRGQLPPGTHELL